MSANVVPPPAITEYKKDGSISKMRCHKGNIPILPQTKLCPHCPAKFTRTTHLNRHLRTHSNEKLYHCDTCPAQFTRSDLLTRHKRSCNDVYNSSRTRRKSCKACAESKIKCDLQLPCAKCTSRGKECLYSSSSKAGTSTSGHSVSASASPLYIPPEDVKPLPTASGSAHPTSSPVALTGLPYRPPLPHNMPSQPTDLRMYDQGEKRFARSTDLPYTVPHLPTPGVTASELAESEFRSSMASESETVVPVSSHLNALYNSDVFEPFFSNIFSDSSSSSPTIANADENMVPSTSYTPDEFLFSTSKPPNSSQDEAMYTEQSGFPMHQGSAPYPPYPILRPAVSDVRHASFPDESTAEELQHYLYLFFTAFSTNLPIVHRATFVQDDKPPVLLSAMHACGALYVKTRKAANFITNTLISAREILIREFARNPTDPRDQAYLLIAVTLLQIIGLFHQKSDVRMSSNIYHGMIVMMIRRNSLMALNASWRPLPSTEASVEVMWQDWAYHETIKRALTLSYLHDCCHTIYFALSPSYSLEEIQICLPCEDKLFEASTAAEWLAVLNTPSEYGEIPQRLTGAGFMQAFEPMSRPEPLEHPLKLSPFAHFHLQHTILRQLFCACLGDRIVGSQGINMEPEIHRLQFSLHNWLKSWMASPDLPKVDPDNEEPPFIQHSLQFYWLGQISLLAYQEGLPPFEANSPDNLKSEMRLRLVKKWLKHIRRFLCRTDQAPTLLWDELMKIRLRSRKTDLDGEAYDHDKDKDGILSFWPDH